MGNGGSEHIFFSPLAPKEWLFFLVVKKTWVFGIFGDPESHPEAAGSAWEEHFDSPKWSVLTCRVNSWIDHKIGPRSHSMCIKSVYLQTYYMNGSFCKVNVGK